LISYFGVIDPIVSSRNGIFNYLLYLLFYGNKIYEVVIPVAKPRGRNLKFIFLSIYTCTNRRYKYYYKLVYYEHLTISPRTNIGSWGHCPQRPPITIIGGRWGLYAKIFNSHNTYLLYYYMIIIYTRLYY
jgi:hypothetical protein